MKPHFLYVKKTYGIAMGFNRYKSIRFSLVPTIPEIEELCLLLANTFMEYLTVHVKLIKQYVG